MSYHHVLIAVDFNEGCREVIDKAVKLAKPLNAMLSLIHINKQKPEQGGLIDIELADIEPDHPTAEQLEQRLDKLAAELDYPIEHKIVVDGDLSHAFEAPVKEAKVDLIVCGHHHNLWSRLKPSARELINTSLVDLLIVSLKD